MPVVIEGFDVLALNRVLETCYPTGVAGFAADAGRSRFCTDRTLAKAAFDTKAEALAFAQYLQQRGLIPSIGDSAEDFAILTKNLHFMARCNWIMPGTYQGVPIAWSPGARPSRIVVPEGWRRRREPWLPPPQLEAHELDSRLEFLRKEGPHDIYRDRFTNQEMRVVFVDE
jgi:hypothetical protein